MFPSAAVLIAAGPEAESYDVRRLAGRLAFDHLPFTVVQTIGGEIPPDFTCRPDVVYVLVGAKQDRRFRFLARWRRALARARIVVMAGREVTYQQEQLLPLGKNELVVYGDPEDTVAELLREETCATEWRGQRFRGTVWDPKHFAGARIAADRPGAARVLLSAGCNRQCGYCPYGYNFTATYGRQHGIRFRPAGQVIEDLRRCAEAGFASVRLEADQAFDDAPEHNEIFSDIATVLDASGAALRCEVTLASADVIRNSRILESCASRGRWHVYLNVDFASDSMLRKFRLASSVQDHLSAFELLNRFGISFDVNFIFFHPWLDALQIAATLDFLRTSARYFRDRATPFAHVLLHQFLLTSFQTDACIPADPALRDDALTTPSDVTAMRFAYLLGLDFERDRDVYKSALRGTGHDTEQTLLDRFERLLARSVVDARSTDVTLFQPAASIE